MRFCCVFGLIVATLIAAIGRADDDLTVLKASPEAGPPDQLLERALLAEVRRCDQRRREALDKAIVSEAACRDWQRRRRDYFLEVIGGLPERTPLNAQIVGVLPGRGYRVEKIMLETRPGFHLTANFYLPDAPPPWPAVLVACGHSHDGKAVGQYQLVCRLLARHGLAAICYDPIGQGERYQILDPQGRRTVFEDGPHVATPHPHARLLCTTEHTMMALGCTLLGTNVAQYRIWDGMRVVDYLQSRPDVIADKIGCTGNSGGGTETAYLMALDDRIVAAAPGCFLTTLRKLLETKGPQDGEQNLFGQLAVDFDEADYCILRAPRPTLICAGTRDATFHFDGTWDLFRDVKRFYSRFGHADAVDIVAPDAPHGFTLQLREAVTRFMARHLLGKEVVVREIETLPDRFTDDELRAFSMPDFTAEQLQCTPDGQVLLLSGERSVFELNSEMAERLKADRSSTWRGLDAVAKAKLIRRTIGIPDVDRPEVAEPRVTLVGETARDDYVVRKLSLTSALGVPLPALEFVPRKPDGRVVLYLHGAGMKPDAAPGGPIESLVGTGRIVLAAELSGIGETETVPRRGRTHYGAGRFGPDLPEVMTAYLLGRSHVGMRTEDATAWLRYLQRGGGTGEPPKEIELIAVGEAAIPALHTAALAPGAFRSVSVRRMIPSWEAIVRTPETYDQATNVVHGALRHYDLPDLAAMLGDRISITESAGAADRATAP
ncbi:MAG: hypothetical protein J0M17_20085 [Planctomycetes bacterium]|nr:hypothetical protein [Planctomycetota bacterium]